MKKYYIFILSLFFVVNIQAQCVADFIYVKDSTTVRFADSSNADGNYICTYSWDFGDGNISSGELPIHTYDSAGTYTVCLEIITASDSSCSDTVCIDSICKNITVNNNCHLKYEVEHASASGACDGSIKLIITGGVEPYRYEWNTGDTLSFLNDLCAGTYTVTIRDNDSCTDSLTIEILEYDTLIRGAVYAKSTLLPEGIILLINSEGKVISSTSISSGRFAFNTLPDSKKYSLYAVPYFDVDEEYYPQYFPTYTGDALYWQSASLIEKDTLRLFNIHLKYYDDIIHGQGFLSGTVYYDDSADFEEDIYNKNWFGNFTGACHKYLAANITVLLMDKDKNVLKSCLTDNNGYYQFSHLPLQDYIVHVEKNAKNTLPKSVNLTSDKDSIFDFNFTIKENTVTEIQNIEAQKENLQIAPNPFSDYLMIKSKSSVSFQKIEVRDLQSRLIYIQEKEGSFLKINTQKWGKGIYFIRLWTSNNKLLIKKVIKN